MKNKIVWLASLSLGIAGIAATQTACSKAKMTEATAVPAAAVASDLVGWTTDLDKALVDAKSQNKPVLVEFTGSTWCPECIHMTKTVFTKSEFIDPAAQKFIMVEVDVPASNGAVANTDKNTRISETYRVEQFPLIVLLNPDGKEFSRFFPSDYPETSLLLKQLDNELSKNKHG